MRFFILRKQLNARAHKFALVFFILSVSQKSAPLTVLSSRTCEKNFPINQGTKGFHANKVIIQVV